MSTEIERRTETIPAWKADEIEDLLTFLQTYDSIGIVGVTGIPSRQLQQMRAELHGNATLRMSRNTLITRALDAEDDGLETLTQFVTGQVGIVGTNDNPFTLYRRLEESKTPAPINAGEVAPNDIVIPEGDTGMDPGPFVGELQAVGASAQIIEGTIKVTASSVVAEQGDVVTDDLANVLSELEIEPKEVGLDLRGVYADGILFEADDLAIDLDEYRANVETAGANALALSIAAEIPTDRTIEPLLVTASSRAKSVGLAAAIESPSLLDDLVTQADAQVRSIAAHLPDEALPEELRGATPETPPPPAEEPAESTDDQSTDEPTPDTADEDDDDDEGPSGEGIGAMFG